MGDLESFLGIRVVRDLNNRKLWLRQVLGCFFLQKESPHSDNGTPLESGLLTGGSIMGYCTWIGANKLLGFPLHIILKLSIPITRHLAIQYGPGCSYKAFTCS